MAQAIAVSVTLAATFRTIRGGGTGYAESELAGDDDGDGNLTGLGHNLDRFRRSVKISG